jgi:SAM-dependent methyltransferase
MTGVSADYHDYVFRNGAFVGDFEGMYRHSAAVPWHQDETAYDVFSEIGLAILRKQRYRTICDVGCGLGYFTARCRRELEHPAGGRPTVTGLGISETAVTKARRRFPEIRFLTGNILAPALPVTETFDLVLAKDLMWYVCAQLDEVLGRLTRLTGQTLYIGQSFPDTQPWVGQDVLSCPDDLLGRVAAFADVKYACIERDNDFGGRPYIHLLAAPRPRESGRPGWS